MEKQKIEHPWGAVFDEHSRILILGTMPSPKSRELGFYYGHPQNVFWKTLAEVLGSEPPARTLPAARAFLLENHIALWDVLASCEIRGASDAAIADPVPNDFSRIFEIADIQQIFATGKAAANLFNKLCAERVGMSAQYLPSTSPANCAMHGKPEFLDAWGRIKKYL